MFEIVKFDYTCQNRTKINNNEIVFEALCLSYWLQEIRLKGNRHYELYYCRHMDTSCLMVSTVTSIVVVICKNTCLVDNVITYIVQYWYKSKCYLYLLHNFGKNCRSIVWCELCRHEVGESLQLPLLVIALIVRQSTVVRWQ